MKNPTDMDAIEQNIGDTNQHQVAGQPNEEGQVKFQFNFLCVFNWIPH